ncbi:hypothetical protein TNCT_271701 [Trichonephila clavata]|uniref:Uncharacterized protein n=1 Tax=Trichonephila clavata TaxID=2740835 RepID=A0A8X6IAH4_TRICU|nr:hypothetical protein TNCT_271701 [Trichonephila clavata]
MGSCSTDFNQTADVRLHIEYRTCRTSTENLLGTSPSTSTGEIRAVDPTPQKIVEDDIQDDSNVQLDILNRNHLGSEYQNDFGLWRNITEDVRNFWCKRNSTAYQYFDNEFSVSCRQ